MRKVIFLLFILLIGCTSQVKQLDIPYVEQKGPSCTPAQVLMALKYYFPEKEYSLSQIDKLMGRDNEEWTWFSQAFPVLLRQGLDVYYYSTTPYFQITPEFLRKFYGEEDGAFMDSVTDWVEFEKSVKFLKQNPERFSNTKLSWNEVEEAVNRENLVLMIIDNNVLEKRIGVYNGHGITITKITPTKVYFHDSSLEPNRIVSKMDFIAAWNAPGTDNDVILIKGVLNE